MSNNLDRIALIHRNIGKPNPRLGVAVKVVRQLMSERILMISSPTAQLRPSNKQIPRRDSLVQVKVVDHNVIDARGVRDCCCGGTDGAVTDGDDGGLVLLERWRGGQGDAVAVEGHGRGRDAVFVVSDAI